MDKVKFTINKTIYCFDWDDLVTSVYKRPYTLQQQNDCYSRQQLHIEVPCDSDDSFMNDNVSECDSDSKMGVKFSTWLARDPSFKGSFKEDYEVGIFWDRKFYPDLGTIANDLYEKGYIDKGKYVIDIDW